jgi:pantetheine-phosphate adenylyltransferase
MTTAVYAGSFDPVTLGHLDLILKASKSFQEVIVGVGANSQKKQPLFDQDERIKLVRGALSEIGATKSGFLSNIYVMPFNGLLVDFCLAQSATVIVRGLRAVSDFEVEMAIAHANSSMCQHIDTVFFPTKPEHSFVSSSTVKEIAFHPSTTGWASLHQYVTSNVLEALREKKFK